MRNRPLMILGAAFLIVAVYLFFTESLHGVTSWQVALIIGALLVIGDLELKKLRDRIARLEVGTSTSKEEI